MSSSVWEHLLEHPADLDALRVYADSLLEASDGRGELIHVALALEALPDWDPRRDPLAARLRTLRRQYERSWTAPALTALQTGGSWYGLSVELKRGIPAGLSVDARTLLRDAEHVFRLAPISDLRVYAVRGADLGPLAALGQLSRLRGLELHFGNVSMPSADELRAFFDAVKLDALEALVIDVRDLDTARVLALAPSLPRLQRLTLEPALIPLEQNLSRARTHIGAKGLELLLGAPQLKGLTALRLVRQNLGPAGALLLAEATALRRLELAGNALGSVGVEALARSASRGQLTRLTLAGDTPGVAGLEALAAADLPRLHTLELEGDARLGLEGLEALAQARWAGQLRKLTLAAGGLEVKAMRALAGTPALKDLQVLSLAGNPLGDAGAAALGAASSLPALRRAFGPRLVKTL